MAAESAWNMPTGELMKGKKGLVMGVANANSIALGGQLRGDAPGDGVGVRHPHDQALLALHQFAGGEGPG